MLLTVTTDYSQWYSRWPSATDQRCSYYFFTYLPNKLMLRWPLANSAQADHWPMLVTMTLGHWPMLLILKKWLLAKTTHIDHWALNNTSITDHFFSQWTEKKKTISNHIDPCPNLTTNLWPPLFKVTSNHWTSRGPLDIFAYINYWPTLLTVTTNQRKSLNTLTTKQLWSY